jgi:hypothetical protein
MMSILAQLLGEGQQGSANNQENSQLRAGADASASIRLGNPAPIVLIPGPPGKPGLPGIPGLPGKPGKIPNFRGLKAILTTRVAELLAFLAVVAVMAVLKFLGLLGLLLGLVLPVYGKLKHAGVLVPGESGGYGQHRRKRAVPMSHSLYDLDKLASHVFSSVDAVHAKNY